MIIDHKIIFREIEIPASDDLQGFYFVGCPVGLEPTTFRTTI